jgi:hypothetical protein
MKADRRTLLIGAAVIAVVLLWSAQQARRPACAGGSCCPLPSSLSLWPSNSWTAAEATNKQPAQTNSGALTNRQR